MEPYVANVTSGQRIALASLVGAARAFEEAGLRPAVISLYSGSALFAFPWRPGSVPRKWRPSPSLLPKDYIDVDWLQLPRLAPTLGRGLGGIMRGDAIEEAYRRLLGDMTLGDLPMPAYTPIWNVEQNRVEFLGPRTHPDLPVARAVHMAIALPLFIPPVELDGFRWCDGGIVDIFPVHPLSRSRSAVTSPGNQRLLSVRIPGRRHLRLEVSARQHSLCRKPGAHPASNRACARKPGAAARGVESVGDRASSLRESAGCQLLPAIPQHPRLARIHGGRAQRGAPGTGGN